jgi:uncharacterized membrane protein
MDGLLALLFFVVLALPVVTIIFVIVLFNRNREQARALNSLRDLLSAAQSHVAVLARRVGDLEQPGAGAEMATEPEPEPEPPAMPEERPEPLPAAPPPPQPIEVEPPEVTAPPPPSTPKAEGVERQLGTKVTVWLGSIALALSGGFLVKYSFEQGLIGPATRITLGLAFGLALLGVAEWMYRRVSGVAPGLAAAGIAVLYSSLLAGVRLYDLIPAGVGFAGMALVTLTAVVLALRQGQIVAVLGLLGGFLTPIFISTGEQHPWPLLFYLILLQTGLLFVSRKRRWWPVAGLTLAGAMGWALLWMTELVTIGGSSLHVGLLLMISILSFVMSAVRKGRGEPWGESRVSQALVWGSAGLGILLLSALVGVGDFGLMEWGFLGIVGAGCIVLGRMEARYEGLAWLAAVGGAGMLLIWGFELDPANQMRLWLVAALFGALYIGGSYIAMWGSVDPARWAALATVSGIIYLLTAYSGLRDTDLPIPWGVQALLLAALFIGLAIPVTKRRQQHPRGNVALAALAVAITALVSLAIPMELERAWITVAWAVEIPALAWIAIRLRVPDLEKLAWILAGIVGVRLLLNPEVLAYPIGEGLILNWLLYGYGIPIIAFTVGALLFRSSGSGKFADLLEAGAMALGFAYLSLSIRQYFHPGDLDALDVMFAEWGAYTVVWLLYGLALFALHAQTGRRIHMLAGASAGLLALGQGLLIQVLFGNPLFHAHEVGSTLIFNRLLFVYGLPALLALLLAKWFERLSLKLPALAAGSMALLFAWCTLTLEIRQAFQGSLLNGGSTSNAELYTYSLVWVLFAIALLVAGIATRGVVLRYGSALVMALAVGKVFLVDTAQLEDLYRVFSLFGLGATLMLLAFLYQKFVFREK